MQIFFSPLLPRLLWDITGRDGNLKTEKQQQKNFKIFMYATKRGFSLFFSLEARFCSLKKCIGPLERSCLPAFEMLRKHLGKQLLPNYIIIRHFGLKFLQSPDMWNISVIISKDVSCVKHRTHYNRYRVQPLSLFYASFMCKISTYIF